MNEELKQLRRDSAEYAARYHEYQEACSNVKTVPLPKPGKGAAPERKVR